jgi:predicted N-acetyltransferase YhbS
LAEARGYRLTYGRTNLRPKTDFAVSLAAIRRMLDAPRRIVDVLSLSPQGVVPEFQRQGIGTQLIAHALDAADSQGVPLVFLEGSPRYYGTRGFEGCRRIGLSFAVAAYP